MRRKILLLLICMLLLYFGYLLGLDTVDQRKTGPLMIFYSLCWPNYYEQRTSENRENDEAFMNEEIVQNIQSVNNPPSLNTPEFQHIVPPLTDLFQ